VSFFDDLVKADSLYGIDKDRWMKARCYVAVIRWRLTPMPEPEGPLGPFHVGETLDSDLVNCVLRVVREKLTAGSIAALAPGRSSPTTELQPSPARMPRWRPRGSPSPTSHGSSVIVKVVSSVSTSPVITY
jgi:hypothetical protein